MPLKKQKEAEHARHKVRQAETALKNAQSDYHDLMRRKESLQANISRLESEAGPSTDAIKSINSQHEKLDETFVKIDQLRDEIPKLEKEYENAKERFQEVKQEYGTEFYNWCKPRVEKINELLSEIREINEELKEAGDPAHRMCNFYYPSLSQGFFNRIKTPKRILKDGLERFG